MRVYYSLVDDLFSYETFQALVDEVIEESGHVFDERTSAMIVLRRAGRKHQKIARLSPHSTFVHFFGKVLGKGEVRRFTRDDGSPGAVARIEVGDDTGEVSLVFWDERVSVVDDVDVGEVIEVVGKTGKTHEVRVIDMQPTVCDIPTRAEPDGFSGSSAEGDTIEGTIVAIGETSTFTRRDGSEGERLDVAIADESGIVILVFWDPALLDGYACGDGILASGLRRNTRSAGREYTAGSHASVKPADVAYSPLFTPVAEVLPDTVASVSGTLERMRSAREFTTRKGAQSWVRNADIRDESGSIHLVLWGENARNSPSEGEQVSLYNASCKYDRNGRVEVHASWGCLLACAAEPAREPVTMTGMVIRTARGRCIDDGHHCLLIDADLPVGTEYCVEGVQSRDRLLVTAYTEVTRSKEAVEERIRSVLG